MPFLRISRDKRGYEYFALVHQTAGRRGRTRQRVLYWFRTPPNIKVGRRPFDDAVMRALEAQNPDIVFDWEALRSTPMPPPSAEHWRERRRAEKAMRQVRQGDEGEETAADAEVMPMPDVPVNDVPQEDSSPEVADASQEVRLKADATTDSPVSGTTSAASAIPRLPGSGPGRRRRRRRRGRRGPGGAPTSIAAPTVAAPQTEHSQPSSTEADTDEPLDDEGSPDGGEGEL